MVLVGRKGLTGWQVFRRAMTGQARKCRRGLAFMLITLLGASVTTKIEDRCLTPTGTCRFDWFGESCECHD
jgi:hypothetical protein